MITVRGHCSKEKDGKIHTDSKTKIITVLLYMNPTWETVGGQLRLLKSPNDIDDMILEVRRLIGGLWPGPDHDAGTWRRGGGRPQRTRDSTQRR